ncbi:MAG TPA: rhamnogalacturonan acetylesterase [Bryobacteraceae bacterium]|jgi:lysophospholipase L1-like esterase
MKALLFLAAALAWNASGQVTKIVLVGDSTVAEGGGWGPGFRSAMGSGYEVVNLARNGRSSKSFRDEGAWAPALTAGAKYIFIQFGHNDGPGKGADRETDPQTSFHANMSQYVEEARAAGAIPVLVTSIVRRNLTAEGKVKVDTLAPYAEEVRRVAMEEQVPLIDLYALTLAQCEALGAAGCGGLNAKAADGSPDTTHLSPKGQAEIGAIVARKFATSVLPWSAVLAK